MNTEHLRYLLTVAECGSIRGACEQLQLKQQYLSNLVKNLETQFGTQIFTRHSRGVTPTEDGYYLLGYAQQIVALADTMSRDYLYPSSAAQRAIRTDLIIYTPPIQSSKRFVRNFRHFLTIFPNVRLILRQQSRAESLESLESQDNAICLYPSRKNMNDIESVLPEALKAIRVRSSQMVAVTSAENSTAYGRREISCQELVNLPLVSYSPWGLDNSVVAMLLKDSSDLLHELISQGDLYAIMDRGIATAEGLIQIPLKEEVQLNVYVIVNARAYEEQMVLRSAIDALLQASVINTGDLSADHAKK